MNVVFINHNSADHLGGAERSMLTLIDRWAMEDPELAPIVVSPGPAPAFDSELVTRGWRHVVLDFEGWAVFTADGGAAEEKLRERRAAAATRSIAELLRETSARLVVTNTLVHPWGAIAAAMVGIPHVWFVREFGHDDQGFLWPGGRGRAIRGIGELSHVVIANSHAVADDLRSVIADEKLVISYPPVDTDGVRSRAREPLRAHPAPYPDRLALSICVLGRVTASKGQWRVADALRLLADRGIAVQACFVGALLDPGIEAELTRRAPSGSLTFVGEQENPFPYVAAADIAVTPSQREAFGRTTLECLAIGRPVITTREGAGAELITPEVGAAVPADSVAELAAAIRAYADDRLLARRQESPARRRAVELMTGEHSADVAVRSMRAAVGAAPASLPSEWAAWVAVLDATADGGHPGLWARQASAARAAALAGKAMRDPGKAFRRLSGRG